MLDTDASPCEKASLTVPVFSFEETDAAQVVSEGGEKTSNRGGPRPGLGGPQPGSGRPRKVPQICIVPEIEPIRWFCVRTEYAAEITADMAIRNAGFETLFPLIWVAPVGAHRSADGRSIPARSERLVPLLPRYLLVRFCRTDSSWRDICTMRGVERIFSAHPERPTPIPDKDIDDLRRDLAPNGVLYPPKAPERAKNAKKRWVDMATALLTMLEHG